MLPPSAPPLHRDAVPDTRARAHAQHTETLARDKEAVVARYRESLALVPGALADVAGQGARAAKDMTALMESIEVCEGGRGGSVRQRSG